MPNHEDLYPHAREIAEQRNHLAPAAADSFRAFSKTVFAGGSLDVRTKQLIAVAVAHVTQCPYCIRGHAGAAVQHGASPEQIMEAIWVAAEMRAGAAYAHSALALDEIVRLREAKRASKPEHGVDIDRQARAREVSGHWRVRSTSPRARARIRTDDAVRQGARGARHLSSGSRAAAPLATAARFHLEGTVRALQSGVSVERIGARRGDLRHYLYFCALGTALLAGASFTPQPSPERAGASVERSGARAAGQSRR